MIDPPNISERVTRQSARMTIHPSPPGQWPFGDGLKLVIPHKSKLSFKIQLDRMGINEASLFPGTDAIARYLHWQVKWDRFYKA